VKTTKLFLPTLLALLAGCTTDPKAIGKKYVDRGNQYFSRHQYKEASILYRRALNKDLRSPVAWYRLGLVNARLRALPEARKDFSRAMELDPGNQDAIVQLGDLDLAFYLLDPPGGREFLADLKEIAQRLLKQDPRSFDGLRFSGNIALAANDAPTAIHRFQAANQSKPHQPDLVLTLVQTLFAVARDDEGEKLAWETIDGQKAFAPLYDALYVHYLRGNRAELAEQVLRKKIANNPAQAAYLIQLASHYYLAHRSADMRSTIAHLTSDRKSYPDGRLQAGDFFVRVRDYPAALQQFDAGEKESPKSARVYRKKIAEVLATQGARDRAEMIVARLIKDDSKDPEALALRATLRLASGDPRLVKGAIAELQPLTAKLPGNASLHSNLGRAYLAATDQQNLDKAREQLEIALRLDPHHAPAKLALAELALARGETARAVQATSEVLGEDSTNLAAHLIRASALAKMAEPQKSREELTMLLRIYPNSNDARDQLAELDFQEHRYDEAESGFRVLAQTNDGRGAPGLLKTEIAQGQFQEAIRVASDRLKSSPQRADYRLALAQVEVAAGNYSAAAAQFQAVIGPNSGKKPQSSTLYLQMGEAKLRGGDIPGALAAFQRARQLAPADAAPSLDLALLYDRTERSPEARKEYENVIQVEPDNATALNNLAYLEAEEGVDLDRALAHAQRAQQKLPDDPNVQDTLALVYIRKNLTMEGLRMLRDLVNRQPGSASFRLHLALALYQKGDRTSARRELQAALRNQPNQKEQNKIRELLAKVG
jgi:tetratricopeptide (TPR) repeat protein